jgi:hypothetical protein
MNFNINFSPFVFGMAPPGVYPLDFKGKHAFNCEKLRVSLKDNKKASTLSKTSGSS